MNEQLRMQYQRALEQLAAHIGYDPVECSVSVEVRGNRTAMIHMRMPEGLAAALVVRGFFRERS